jgi:hypothetical protein
MRNIKSFVFYILLAGLVSSGCKKSNSNPASAKNTVLYTFQGTKYSFSNPLVTIQSNGLGISGSQNESGIDIYVANYKIGTFQVGGGNDSNVLPQPSTSTTGYTSISGTITITSLTNTEVIGNFQTMAVQIGQNANTASPLTGTFDVQLPQ